MRALLLLGVPSLLVVCLLGAYWLRRRFDRRIRELAVENAALRGAARADEKALLDVRRLAREHRDLAPALVDVIEADLNRHLDRRDQKEIR